MYNEYSTKDLGETAALITAECNMKNIIWKDNVAYFVFDEADKCKEFSQKYFFGNLALPVKTFYENLKTVKKKLYGTTQMINGYGLPGRNKQLKRGGGKHV